MAGNTRGKIKEKLVGCHKNCDWIQVHLAAVVILIQEHNPKLKKTIETLVEANKVFDDSIQAVYGQI